VEGVALQTRIVGYIDIEYAESPNIAMASWIGTTIMGA
jgi:hypothetical protein